MSEPSPAELTRRVGQARNDIDSLYELTAGIDRKVDALDVRVGALDTRVAALDAKVDRGFAELRSDMDRGFAELRGQLEQVLRLLSGNQ